MVLVKDTLRDFSKSCTHVFSDFIPQQHCTSWHKAPRTVCLQVGTYCDAAASICQKTFGALFTIHILPAHWRKVNLQFRKSRIYKNQTGDHRRHMGTMNQQLCTDTVALYGETLGKQQCRWFGILEVKLWVQLQAVFILKASHKIPFYEVVPIESLYYNCLGVFIFLL